MDEHRVTEKTVGDFVAEDYRTARVFEKHGIDFCCGGKVNLVSVCQEKRIDPDLLLREIEEAKGASVDRGQNFDAWELSFLADYIVINHHSYIRSTVDKLCAYVDRVADVHGGNHHEVIEIAALFHKIAGELSPHLLEEEETLFPAVKRAEAAAKAGNKPDGADALIINGCISKLVHEHEEVGEAVHTIRRLASDYILPDDACNTFMVTYRMLKEFEDDLHKHVHLENNILFLKAEML